METKASTPGPDGRRPRRSRSRARTPTSSQLFVAAQKGQDARVRALLAAGADKDLVNNNGATSLLVAAWNGHDAVVRVLLDAGADKDLAMKDGATPVLVAAHKGHDAVVRTLLDAGITEETLKAWTVDPRVPMPDGTQGSLFDALEDLDLAACIEKAKAIAVAKPA